MNPTGRPIERHVVTLVVVLGGRLAWASCSCGWRGERRSAIAGRQAMRRAALNDELRHRSDVDAIAARGSAA